MLGYGPCSSPGAFMLPIPTSTSTDACSGSGDGAKERCGYGRVVTTDRKIERTEAAERADTMRWLLLLQETPERVKKRENIGEMKESFTRFATPNSATSIATAKADDEFARTYILPLLKLSTLMRLCGNHDGRYLELRPLL